MVSQVPSRGWIDLASVGAAPVARLWGRRLPRLSGVTERRPALLLVVCVLVTLEAAAFLGLGIAWTADVVRGNATLPGASLFLAAFGVGIALLLLLGARGLWRGRRWARSPIITWQILLVVLALGWLGSQPSAWAVVVLVVATLAGVGLLLPPVVAVTSGRRQEPVE